MNFCERMAPEQIAQLALAICATADIMGGTLTADAARIMADDLAHFPPDAVSTALKACRRELNGRLTLAAILQRVQATDGRPARDEAWSIALAATDEYDTVVMTAEIQLALNAARPVLEAGDKIGARMAFISTYDRLVLEARAEGRPAKWEVSIGFDAGRRIAAVSEAMYLRRISRESAQWLLADLSHEPVTIDGRALAGLLTGPDVMPASAEVHNKLEAIRAQMQEMREGSEARRQAMKIAAANELAERLALLSRQAQSQVDSRETTSEGMPS
jgi:hypothetical protein